MSEKLTDTNSESSFNRRRVLKSAATAGAIAGIGGLASARSTQNFTAAEAKEITEEYRNLDVLKASVAQESEVLESVAEAGYIEEASVDALGIETLGEPVSESDSKVIVDPHSAGGEVTADIRVAREYDDGELVVSVQPEADRSFAIFKPHGTDEIKEVDVSGACGGCASNEECQSTCQTCGAETCTGCNRDPTMKVIYTCQCVENCGSW